jgi:hypothetical protein
MGHRQVFTSKILGFPVSLPRVLPIENCNVFQLIELCCWFTIECHESSIFTVGHYSHNKWSYLVQSSSWRARTFFLTWLDVKCDSDLIFFWSFSSSIYELYDIFRKLLEFPEVENQAVTLSQGYTQTFGFSNRQMKGCICKRLTSIFN